uniref:Uncharacterized protein n=1 Tax=Megaselia scalaris TaxID=36166 RepID=T1GKU7_MEGSC
MTVTKTKNSVNSFVLKAQASDHDHQLVVTSIQHVLVLLSAYSQQFLTRFVLVDHVGCWRTILDTILLLEEFRTSIPLQFYNFGGILRERKPSMKGFATNTSTCNTSYGDPITNKEEIVIQWIVSWICHWKNIIRSHRQVSGHRKSGEFSIKTKLVISSRKQKWDGWKTRYNHELNGGTLRRSFQHFVKKGHTVIFNGRKTSIEVWIEWGT